MKRTLMAIGLFAAASAAAAPPPPAPAAAVNCTDVTVGSAQGYDCLNARLAGIAQGTQRPSSATDAPISATSPSNQVGTFNESATRNRLGANFGKSVQPVRPVQTYLPPLVQPGHPR